MTRRRFDNTHMVVRGRAPFSYYQKLYARALISGVKEKQNSPQSLKDLVFKGAFFVILVYFLVYAYNTGIFSRLINR